MTPHCCEMMETLRAARTALEAGLQTDLTALPADRARLVHLGASAAALAQQADRLAAALAGCDAEGAPLREAEKLAAYFRAAVDRLADQIEAGVAWG